ncbi:MAG: cysteine synthase A [Clostridia bacterium]|nr:cysteine synthase A [Clostridia bacterium]
MIFNSVSHLIGRTPVVRLSSVEKHFGLCARLYAKLESFNPSGSVKDRAALFMLEDGKRRGIISRGSVIVEATSGNMGISLAMLSSVYGCRCVIVMPDSMSEERRRLIAAYGGELVLGDGAKGMQGAIERAGELLSEIKAACSLSQFENPMNRLAHYNTTGPEIYSDMRGEVDIFVSGVGTGGTISGTGRYLKEKKPSVITVAVEPSESAVLSGKKRGSHSIQGIGAGFVPPLFDREVVDFVMAVSGSEAASACRVLGRLEGIFSGISSGAAISAAITLGKREENRGKNILVIFPDGGEKYLSVGFGN